MKFKTMIAWLGNFMHVKEGVVADRFLRELEEVPAILISN